MSLLLCLVMVAGMLPTVALAANTETGNGKAIQLGTKGISAKDVVYYGYFGTWPVSWYVLGEQTNVGTEGLFLLSQYCLSDSGERGGNDKAWFKDFAGESGSSIPDAFTAEELAAIMPTTKNDPPFHFHYNERTQNVYYTGMFLPRVKALDGDKLFYPSADEATQALTLLGEDNSYSRSSYSGAASTTPNSWPLRSYDTSGRYGQVYYDSWNSSYRGLRSGHGGYPRPAFNMAESSVLFSSNVGAKAAGNGQLSSVGAAADTEWKLTVLDSSREFRVTNTTVSDNTVTVTYKNAKTGENEYISAVIIENGELTHYGRMLQLDGETNAASGTASFTLPDGVMLSDTVKLYVFNEQYRGEAEDANNLTDYGSRFIEVLLEAVAPVTVTIEPQDGYFPPNNVVETRFMETSADGKLDSLPVPSKYQHVFDGWYTEAEGGAPVTADTVFTENTTIYAHWRNYYIITFDASGGAVTPASVQVSAATGKLTAEQLPSPTRDGYDFYAWKTAPSRDYLIESYDTEELGVVVTTDTKFTEDTTVYACWRRTITELSAMSVTNPYFITGEELESRYVIGNQITRDIGFRVNSSENYADTGNIHYYGQTLTVPGKNYGDVFLGGDDITGDMARPDGIGWEKTPEEGYDPNDPNSAAWETISTTASYFAGGYYYRLTIPIYAVNGHKFAENLSLFEDFPAESGTVRVVEKTSDKVVVQFIFNPLIAQAVITKVDFSWDTDSVSNLTITTEPAGLQNVLISQNGGYWCQRCSQGQYQTTKETWTRASSLSPGFYYKFSDTYKITDKNYQLADNLVVTINGVETTNGVEFSDHELKVTPEQLYEPFATGSVTVKFSSNRPQKNLRVFGCPSSKKTDATTYTINPMPTPTCEGYIFEGWYNAASGGMQFTEDTVIGRDSITLYARWRSNILVTFDPQDGTVDPTSTYTELNGTLASLPVPTKTGQVFAGWYTDATEGELVTTKSVFSASTTIYARWRDKTTVTFDAQDGTVAIASADVEPDGTLASLPTPTREGHAFEGWYTAATGGTLVTAGTPFYEDTTVYARWRALAVVTFDAGEGGTPDHSSLTVRTDNTIQYLPYATKEGYAFEGWYTAAEGGSQITNKTQFTENTTVYAHWVTAIESIAITLTEPTIGGKPAGIDNVTMTSPGDYVKIVSLNWWCKEKYAYVNLASGEPFEDGYTYRLNVYFEVKPGGRRGWLREVHTHHNERQRNEQRRTGGQKGEWIL